MGSRRSPMGRSVEPLVILARLMGLPASSGSISDPPSPAARKRRPAKPRSPQRGFLTPTPSPAFPDFQADDEGSIPFTRSIFKIKDLYGYQGELNAD
jgi:hypothetical protein